MLSFKDHTIVEAIQYNMDKGIPLSECVFRRESETFYEYFNYLRSYQSDLDIDEFGMTLLESDLGQTAIYEGNEVPLDLPFIVEEEEKKALNKPKRGGSKKYYVYVKDGDKVKKISFGDKGGAADGSTLSAKINDKEARASYAARHKCSQQKDRTSAAYWSCNLPRYAKSLGLSGGGNFYW
jgi:hypothetical protein